MPDKGFDSAAPEPPRNGAYVTAVGFTENENAGVVVALVPCPECGAAVEENNSKHEEWHAEQGGAEPKSAGKSESKSSGKKSDN
jgi:hypothetical protein